MRIAYISDSIYPYNKGGKEKRLFELATRLSEMGHDVHIYTMRWWDSPEKVREESGITLHAISKYYPLYSKDTRSIKESLFFAFACLKLIRIKADIIDVDHMPFFPVFTTWIVCKLKGKKLFGTWHESLSLQDWKSYMGTSGYIASLIERASIKLPDYITAASPQTLQLLDDYHGRTKGVGLVASGIDSKLIMNVAPSKEKSDVLYVGRLVKDKNIDMLIDAIRIASKQMPNINCLIIGHGIEQANLAKRVKKIGLSDNITFKQPLASAEDVYGSMKSAKVFALPSRREGFGIVALEAIACGTPVVTIDTSANAARHLIEDNLTGTVTANTPEAFAAALLEWVARPKRYAPQEFMKDHDWHLLAQTQEGIYSV